MRDRGTGTLTTAHEQGWALGAFSTYTQEITQAICRAAQDAGRPVILQAGARGLCTGPTAVFTWGAVPSFEGWEGTQLMSVRHFAHCDAVRIERWEGRQFDPNLPTTAGPDL